MVSSLDDKTWSSSTSTSKGLLFKASLSELQALYDTHLKLKPSLQVVDGVEECFAPAHPFPSQEFIRKKDAVMADYFTMCSKLRMDPLCPNDEVITKLILFIASTNTWNAYSIKYILFQIKYVF